MARTQPRSAGSAPYSRSGGAPEPAGVWVWWLVYGGIALVGFGFGVWVGTQKPKAVEVVRNNPQPVDTTKAGEKGGDTPGDKGNTAQPPNKGTDPKPPVTKSNDPIAGPEPKKEPKIEPKPEPKVNPEPKKPEPMTVATNLTFDKDIKPILRVNCMSCHGDPTIKGGLDIRTLATIKQGGESGAGVIGGNPDNSPVWDRIKDNSMPPKDSKKMLTDAEKKMIREWIAGGAK
ncbi:MAG TPA: c-type cytochrome domain-containing protein [Gemmataceae bacterium]|nr:c-type cytochrome domain-containing protein [Gemmataceae bacterium]